MAQNHPKSVGSIFSGFLTRGLSDSTETMSPVSVLDAKPSSIGCISRGIGLVLDEKSESNSGEFNKILFGSNHKIQLIPNLPSSPPVAGAAADFGIKTRDSSYSPRTVSSLSEMEYLSEDYTCVISHGPNPRTTHIFDNCILQDNVNAVSTLSHSNTS